MFGNETIPTSSDIAILTQVMRFGGGRDKQVKFNLAPDRHWAVRLVLR